MTTGIEWQALLSRWGTWRERRWNALRGWGVGSLTLLCLILCTMPAAAQAPQPEEPMGVSSTAVRPSSEIQRIVLAPVNERALKAEDAVRGKGQPPRFALPIGVNITPGDAGNWERLDPGTMIWRLRVASPGAKSLNLGFTEYVMPPGGRLFVYPIDYVVGSDPQGSKVRRFTEEDNEEHGQLWTPIVPGDEVMIEVVLPERARNALKLKLSVVGHDYKGFGKKLLEQGEALKSGSCNVDVACPEADPYRDQVRAVGVISLGGSTFCTGSLINNTARDGKPFFITADHCGVRASNAASLVVFWNFQNSTCRPVGSPESGGPGDGQLNQFNTGSIFRATSSASDFTLVELDDPLRPEHNLFLAGWNRRDGTYSGAVGIHHPGTDEKRISISRTATQISSQNAPDSHHHVFWRPGIGVTEPGSSGSPLYSPDGLFIGQLTGGPSSCGAADADKRDFYGRIFKSWTGGGTNSTRLSNWLDSINSGEISIPGRNAGGGDTTPPTTTITSPANGATVSGTVTVSANASDNVAVTRVEFLVDDVIRSTDTTAPYTFAWNTTGFSNGNHSLQTRAFDPSNLIGTSATVNVTVDNGGGAVTVFSDGAESATSPMQRTNVNAGTQWTRNTTSPFAGSFRWRAGSSTGGNYGNNGDARLTTPALDLSGASTATLTFAYKQSTEQNFDFFQVRVSTDGGSTFTTLLNVSGVSPGFGNYSQRTVNLNSFAGRTNVRIQFRLTTDVSVTGFGVAVDEIKVVKQ